MGNDENSQTRPKRGITRSLMIFTLINTALHMAFYFSLVEIISQNNARGISEICISSLGE